MEKSRAYTLSVESVYEILSGAQSDCELSRELLSMFLDVPHSNEYVCFLLSEVYWTSYSAIKILEREIDTAVFTEKDEFLMAEDSLQILQSLMISKHSAASELKNLSISLQKN